MKWQKGNTSSAKYKKGRLNTDQIRNAPNLTAEWKAPEIKELPKKREIDDIWDSFDLREKYPERFVPNTTYKIKDGTYYQVIPVEKGSYTSYEIPVWGKMWRDCKEVIPYTPETKKSEKPKKPVQLELF